MNDPATSDPPRPGRTLGPALMAMGLLVVGLAFRISHSGLGDNHDPGPRAFPMALGMALFALGLVEAWKSFRKSVTESSPSPSTSHRVEEANSISPSHRGHAGLNVALLLGGLATYLFLMPWLGFPLATVLFAAGLMLRLGAGWKWSWSMAGLLAASIHLLFVWAFKVQLPAGPWSWPW